MSAELRCSSRFAATKDGLEVLARNETTDPILAVSIDGVIDERTFEIAAGSSATIWTWATNADNWTCFAVLLDGAGEITWKLDIPTSSTDFTPLGTGDRPEWFTEVLSCFAWRVFTSIIQKSNATAATLIGSAFGGASTQDARIYEMQVKNTGTETLTVKTIRAQ